MPYPPFLPPNNRNNTTPQYENHPSDHNIATDALGSIVTELGVGPSGTFDDVTARFTDLDESLARGFRLESQGTQVIPYDGQEHKVVYDAIFYDSGPFYTPDDDKIELGDLDAIWAINLNVGWETTSGTPYLEGERLYLDRGVDGRDLNIYDGNTLVTYLEGFSSLKLYVTANDGGATSPPPIYAKVTIEGYKLR